MSIKTFIILNVVSWIISIAALSISIDTMLKRRKRIKDKAKKAEHFYGDGFS